MCLICVHLETEIDTESFQIFNKYFMSPLTVTLTILTLHARPVLKIFIQQNIITHSSGISATIWIQQNLFGLRVLTDVADTLWVKLVMAQFKVEVKSVHSSRVLGYISIS